MAVIDEVPELHPAEVEEAGANPRRQQKQRPNRRSLQGLGNQRPAEQRRLFALVESMLGDATPSE